MKANVRQQIQILLILLLSCIFLLSTGCSGFSDWRDYDTSTSQMRGNNHVFENSDFNQFYSSVRPVEGNVESDYRLARYFQKRGRHKFAVVELLKAIRKDPSFIKAYNALGVSYDHLGHFDLAVKSYKFALQLNPELDYIHNNLGYSYLLKGNLDAAMDAFQKAIALDNTNNRYHNNLGLAFFRKGQTDMAVEEFKLAENKSSTQNKTAQIFKDPSLSLAPKKTAVDTLPEGITPYDDIQRNSVASFLLACRVKLISPGNPKYTLIPDDYNEINLLEKSYKSEVKSPNLNFANNNVTKTEEPVNHMIQVFASRVEKTLSDKLNRFNAKVIAPLVTQPLNIEISNGNGVPHMASNVGGYLKSKGFNVNRLTNADYFNYPETKIYYRKGYEQDALRLAKEIPGLQKTLNIIEQNQMMRRPIKILLGKDLVLSHEYIMSNLKIIPSVKTG